MTRPTTLLVAIACGLALAACGAQHAVPRATRGVHTVYIYSSLPERGPLSSDGRAIEHGIELALDQARAEHVPGGYTIRYRPLSDTPSRRRHLTWSEVAVRNAETAASNPLTVAYIGDLTSRSTRLSLPILNQAGIMQITPGSGYPGLTDSVKGVTAQTEPGIYYPRDTQGAHTLLRLIPSDLVQAAAAIKFLHDRGCRELGVWQFPAAGAPTELTKAVIATAGPYGLTVAKTGAAPAHARAYYTYLHALASHADHLTCAVLTGLPSRSVALFTDYLKEQLAATIVGTVALCNRDWVGSFTPTVAREVDTSLYCTTPLRPPHSYEGYAIFARQYRARYHRSPQTYAYYGYQAAELVVTAMFGLGPNTDNRRLVRTSLLEPQGATGPLGPFYESGDPTSNAYEIDRIGPRGRALPYRTLTPTIGLGQSLVR